MVWSALAEPHVVGQNGAELRVSQEGQPVDTLLLVGAERRVQSGRQGRSRDAFELAEERGQAGELRRPRRVQRVAQRPHGQQRGGPEPLVRAASREQVGDEMPMSREPVGGQRRPASTLQRHQLSRLARRGRPRQPRRAGGWTRRPPRRRTRTRRRTRRRRRQVASVETRSEKASLGLIAPLRFLPLSQLGGETNCLRSVEIDATSRHQIQLVAQAAQSLTLLAVTSHRYPIAQRHEGLLPRREPPPDRRTRASARWTRCGLDATGPSRCADGHRPPGAEACRWR